MVLFDSHCHLNDEKFNEDIEKVVEKLEKQNIKFLISGYGIESSKQAIKIAKKYNMYATVGISPNDVLELENLEESIKKIEELASQNVVVGIGEIGLDYYWNTNNKKLQELYFVKQIELANKLNMPIAIHSRDAYIDTIKILRENTVINKGVFHCCEQNKELIKDALKLGFYISLAGPITFKNAKNADDIIKMIPLERILIETDSPYLSPEPLRGKRNDPSNIEYIARKIADIKQISIEELAKITYENVKRIYS